MVGIAYDSDLERARKLIMQIGLDLARDPEFTRLILEPLKMQGVEKFGDFAVQIRLKMVGKANLTPFSSRATSASQSWRLRWLSCG
jgi:small-conductance mechanosensitive channel